jgi:plastocyanin
MRRFPLSIVAVALAAGLIVGAVVFAVGGGPQTVTASHGNFNVHVHDDYFHPTGTFVPGPGHANAMALCMQTQPDTSCTPVIHVAPGDSITWIAPAPLAVHPHTITECTDASFSNCGAAVSPSNPIGDSGVLNPPSPGPGNYPYGPVSFPTPGFYYYRCEIHPTVMRGVVQVIANNAPPGGVGGIAGLIPGEDPSAVRQDAQTADDAGASIAMLAAGGAAVVILASVGATYAVRRIRREDD